MSYTGAQVKNMIMLWLGDKITLNFNDNKYEFTNHTEYREFLDNNIDNNDTCYIAMSVFYEELIISIIK